MKKIWGIGETLFLLLKTNTVKEYIVNDINISMDDNGSHQISVVLEDKNGVINTDPFWMIEELINNGTMWRKGCEQFASYLRSKKRNCNSVGRVKNEY